MGTIFAYSLTSALLLATMYLVFKWMLAGENQHRYNRAILWLIYTLSLTLPALIPALKHLTETASHQTGITGIEQAIEIGMPSASIAEAEPLLLPRILLAIYIAGAAAAAVYTVFVAIKLHATISKGEKMYNRENETYNFLKRNVQFSLFFHPIKAKAFNHHLSGN